jgi:phosphate transport system permease protein
MAINADVAGVGPEAPARPLAVSRTRARRRILLDRLASRLVIVGGMVIIASILAILFVILAEVYPLFHAPSVNLLGTYRRATEGGSAAPAPGDSVGVDEYQENAFAVTEAGTIALLHLAGKKDIEPIPVAGLDGARIAAVVAGAKGRYVLGTSDGRVIPLEMKFDVAFDGGRRSVTPGAAFGEPSVLDPEQKRPVLRLAFAGLDSGPITVGQVGPRDLVMQSVVEKKALIGGSRKEESVQTLSVPIEGEVTALRLDGRADSLFVGTSGGQVVRYDLADRGTPRDAEVVSVGASPITALGFLVGDRTLVVGDQKGGVSTWQLLRPPEGGDPRLIRIHDFERHARAVVAVNASTRDKGFVTADASGLVHVHYGTSGKTLLSMKADTGALRSVVISPKGDGVLAVDANGVWSQWKVDNPHPEITLGTVFGKVWYEGYPKPAYVWQSTGGTDDFEAKFSLTPLIFGTLKGTLYALLIAVPLALLAAVYVSEFMHPSVKAYVKPVVEIMAALPSVVLGFLAGLWLAPIIERVVPGLFLLPLMLPVFILAMLLLWRTVPTKLRGRFRPGAELVLLLPTVMLGSWAALALGGVVEMTLLGGNYRGWLLSALGLTYDQRNSLVVGVAMGFAVVPIIFTIAEDSLANVPQHLRAGSLALGATRWQTSLRIVLPTASPGIFSAIMIGFGRAVGETMIVLMATGNTPVMDWSIFNGFRALSANIAVELPEAPEGGTLFRVLFLAAFLLFCLTFAVNSVAEIVRLKLRRKYRYL